MIPVEIYAYVTLILSIDRKGFCFETDVTGPGKENTDISQQSGMVVRFYFTVLLRLCK